MMLTVYKHSRNMRASAELLLRCGHRLQQKKYIDYINVFKYIYKKKK